jgi:hypothetical protein
VVGYGVSDEGSPVVAPGLTVIKDEASELPANGGYTDKSVGGDCCGINIEVAPVSSTPLNPFGIMGVLIHASSSIPICVPKFLSWASPSTWSSV